MNDYLFYRSLGYKNVMDYRVRNTYTYSAFGYFYAEGHNEVFMIYKKFGNLMDFYRYINVDESSYESVCHSLYDYIINSIQETLETSTILGELYINDNYYPIDMFSENIDKQFYKKIKQKNIGVFGDGYNSAYYLTVLNNKNKFFTMKDRLGTFLVNNKNSKYQIYNRLNEKLKEPHSSYEDEENYFTEDLNANKSKYADLNLLFQVAAETEEVPGRTASDYYNDILNGKSIVDDLGNTINIPDITSSVWLPLTFTSLNNGRKLNWLYYGNKSRVDAGKYPKYSYYCDQFGRFTRYDLEKDTFTYQGINHNNGKFRFMLSGQSADISTIVRQTFESAGLSYMVPEQIYSDFTYFIKAPEVLPSPTRIKETNFVVVDNKVYVSPVMAHLSLYNEPQRNSIGKTSYKLIDYLKDLNYTDEEIKEVCEYIKSRYTEIYNNTKETLGDKFKNSNILENEEEN